MKVTKKQFKEFIKHCEIFRNRFGLLDWNIYYRIADLDGSYSEIVIDLPEKTAVIRFNSEIEPIDCEGDWIKNAARHEMIHLLVGKLAYIANERYLTENEVSEAVEGLVHSLERLLK